MILEKVVELLAGFKPDDLRQAVKDNVNLIEVTLKHKPDVLRVVRFANFLYRDELNELTAMKVMIELSVKRPDIYDALRTTPGGMAWLARNVQFLKNYLLN